MKPVFIYLFKYYFKIVKCNAGLSHCLFVSSPQEQTNKTKL